VEDKGIRHVYIKPGTPRINGKVERSHRTDQEEFYQLLTYTGEVDLNEWEAFHIFITTSQTLKVYSPIEKAHLGYNLSCKGAVFLFPDFHF